MKKWLMLAFLPLLLLAQQEVGAIPITTTLTVYPSTSGGSIAPFTSFTLTDVLDSTGQVSEVDINAILDSTVDLMAAKNTPPTGTSVLSNSLIGLFIGTDPTKTSYTQYLNIVTVSYSGPPPTVSSSPNGQTHAQVSPSTTGGGGTITGKLTSTDAALTSTIKSWFNSDYDWSNNSTRPYACLRIYGDALCGNTDLNPQPVRLPFGPVLSVPVPNSSMLMMIGLAALMVPLRRAGQSNDLV